MPRRAVVTGLGAISALGLNVPQFWDALCAGRCGFAELRNLPSDKTRLRIGAEIPDYDPGQHFAHDHLPLLDRFSQLALIAAREAVADAGLSGTKADLASAAVVLGTGCGAKETEEHTYERLYAQGASRVSPLTIPRGMASAAASQLSMALGIRGPTFSVTSACSSANHAIGQALWFIRCGLVDIALAGGTDAPFTVGLVKSWEALRVLSDDTCRPFSRDRSGIVLGEGSGILVIESLESAHRRGTQIYGEVCGCGMSSDAGHITRPSADGAFRAMAAALSDAGLKPSQVDYVNAHGTGTTANDITETRALRMAFGDHAERLAVSSTKSMHGHALGAAGALEAVAAILALKSGIIPPTANFTEAGPGCDLDYVPIRAREANIGAAISNSFAFGGLNAVIALRAFSSQHTETSARSLTKSNVPTAKT